MSAAPAAGIVKRSLTIAGHATSISLEEPFWAEVQRLARQRNLSIAAFVAEIDAGRRGGNLSSALRLAVLADLKARAEGVQASLTA